MTALLKVTEAAQLLSVSVEQMRRYARAGLVRRVVINAKCMRFRREDLEAFIEKRTK